MRYEEFVEKMLFEAIKDKYVKGELQDNDLFNAWNEIEAKKLALLEGSKVQNTANSQFNGYAYSAPTSKGYGSPAGLTGESS